MTTTLDLAFSKAAALPAAARERVALDLLDHIACMSRLRAALDEGLADLDAGFGAPLDIKAEIAQARKEHGAS